jgi:hypothetical protein
LPTSHPSISSAPEIEEFVPPAPTPQDEYPGYYCLPSGKWAAYDPVYYQGFYRKWQADYDKYVRDLEKGKIKGFEELDEENTTGVNAMEEMARTREEIQVKEERKALTQAKDQTAAPRMNIKGAALSGRARTRGQLATLLTEAYQNREAYEDRIAQGRRNRKEAGNKYGEWTSPTFHPRPLMPNHRLLTRARPSQFGCVWAGSQRRSRGDRVGNLVCGNRPQRIWKSPACSPSRSFVASSLSPHRHQFPPSPP